MTTLYDEMPYPNSPRAQTHPLRVSAIATALGAPSAPFETCRVLEVGCGDGGNLFGMALAAPEARFVGIDLAESAIRAGREVITDLGLTNLRLEARDLSAANDDLGTFDYVIAHGVYAWTPAPVREALMALAGRVLSPHGVAFISYNALPGCRIRLVLRDLLLSLPDVREGDFANRIATARATLDHFIALWSPDDPLQRALADEARRMLKRDDAVLFHDELGEVYAPQYLSDTAAQAAAYGLAYLSDVEPTRLDKEPEPSARLSPDDVVALEQAQDFIALRRFRHSIFQRADAGRGPQWDDWRRLRGLWAYAPFRPAQPTSATPGAKAFSIEDGQAVETAHPRLGDLLEALADAYPASILLAPWLTDAAMGEAVLKMFKRHALTLLSAPFGFARDPAERPLAGRLARWQASRGLTELNNLTHSVLEVTDAQALKFIGLLDGRRDRAELARAMFGEVTPQGLAFLDERLRDLAKSTLLAEPDPAP